MTKTIRTPLLFTALLLILGGTARAEHDGFYLGGYYGMPFLQESSARDDLGRFKMDFDAGTYWGGTLGYDLAPGNVLGEGRIEIEYAYRSNNLDRMEFTTGKVDGGGSLRVQSLMANTFGVYRDLYYFAPYLGGGIGAAWVEARNLSASGQPVIDDDSVVFAYQVGVGLEVPISDFLRLDLGYRYFSTLDPDCKEVDGTKVDLEYDSHTVLVGLVVLF